MEGYLGSYVEIYYAGGERIDNIDSYREYFFSFTPPISNLCHLCINEERYIREAICYLSHYLPLAFLIILATLSEYFNTLKKTVRYNLR